VSNGKNPNNGQVFGVPLTLVGAAVTLDLKTLVNLHRVNDVQGIFMDNSSGSAALQVSTTTGQKIIIPAGYQGVMPLYLSADKTITFNGNGSVNIVMLNFPTPANVWPASANGGAEVVSGQLLVSDGTAQTLLAEIVTNTSSGAVISGVISTTDSATHTYLSAIEAELAGTLTISGGVAITGTPNVSDSATHTLLSAVSANTANLENAVVSGGGSAVPSYGVNVGGVYQPSPSSATSGTYRPLEPDPYGALQVDTLGLVPTFTAVVELAAISNATDVCILLGSSSKTIQVLRLEVWLIYSAGPFYLQIIKRTSANSGGTFSAISSIAHDSNDGSASAVLNAYTANPSSVGSGVNVGIGVVAASTSGLAEPLIYDYAKDNQKPMVLRGTSQGLAVNFLGDNGGTTPVYVRFTWREF